MGGVGPSAEGTHAHSTPPPTMPAQTQAQERRAKRETTRSSSNRKLHSAAHRRARCAGDLQDRAGEVVFQPPHQRCSRRRQLGHNADTGECKTGEQTVVRAWRSRGGEIRRCGGGGEEVGGGGGTWGSEEDNDCQVHHDVAQGHSSKSHCTSNTWGRGGASAPPRRFPASLRAGHPRFGRPRTAAGAHLLLVHLLKLEQQRVPVDVAVDADNVQQQHAGHGGGAVRAWVCARACVCACVRATGARTHAERGAPAPALTAAPRLPRAHLSHACRW
jgi:hypothetical protein